MYIQIYHFVTFCKHQDSEWSINWTLCVKVVPKSCCVTGLECVSSDNKTIVDNIWPGDCMLLSLKYVQDHALTLGIANITVCCFLVSHKFCNCHSFSLLSLCLNTNNNTYNECKCRPNGQIMSVLWNMKDLIHWLR